MSEALYRAVITQCLADAVYAGACKPELCERAEARIWLTQSSEDFDEVCALASLEPNAVHAFALKHIAEHDALQAQGRTQWSVTYQGKVWSRAELARHVGIGVGTLNHRLNHMGLTVEEAVTRPVMSGRGHKALSIAA